MTNNSKLLPEIYTSQSTLKWLAVIISVLIASASIGYTTILVKEIREREKKQMDLYARSLEYLANESDNKGIYFILEEIIEANTTIPVILTDDTGNPEFFLNVKLPDNSSEEKKNKLLKDKIKIIADSRPPIEVTLGPINDSLSIKKFIYYQDSRLLSQLTYFPYIQLGVITLFVVMILIVFNFSRLSEQNRVWIGLAKETAHQLGTPLSALMAWAQLIKLKYPNDLEMHEVDQDIERLTVITSRFSNIGSQPQLTPQKIYPIIEQNIQYLKARVSSRVKFYFQARDRDITVMVNYELMSWVFENLIKNAVDAMDGKGEIHIMLNSRGNETWIDIKDSGKGIMPRQIRKIFKPGFTTKTRGWGLGLALVKRIIEQYHKGKVYVKNSYPGKGTTFRIELPITT